ncbi:uncharacterized protein LOC131219930 [Magnolia sinica]|uniref:uncharacterized protein LOC131219930 n=1 Tax=Magnolia sinica TaxID=86752 RepID=UPI00265B1ED0|nr:uncharacterized protein LOC131219930 [Magnolia sinica]
MGWNLLKGNSLWARFMSAKYLDNLFSHQGRMGSVFSPCWKEILSALPFALLHSRLLIGEGNGSFWYKNWMGRGILAGAAVSPIPHHLQAAQVKDFNPISGSWSLSDIQNIISPSALHHISATYVGISNRQDKFIWDLSLKGTFSLKSSWNNITQHSLKEAWSKWLWNRYLPPKLVVFGWKTVHAAVPVDATIQFCGIPLASQCEWCCSHSACPPVETSSSHLTRGQSRTSMLLPQHNNVETLDHLLSTGRSATAVWDYFSDHFDIPVIHNLPPPSASPPPLKPEIVRWFKPPDQWLKLNIDGSSRGNPGESGGGGVCWDHLGRFIFAFHKHYEFSSNTSAEARAMLDGLNICAEMSLQNIILKTDSEVIADDLKVLGSSNLWNIWYILGKIRDLFCRLNVVIHHTYREGNVVADALARLASNGSPDKIFLLRSRLPRCSLRYMIGAAASFFVGAS